MLTKYKYNGHDVVPHLVGSFDP